MTSIEMNLADLVLICMIIIVSILLALHHLAWPFLLRALYSIQRLGLARIRGAAWAIGIALIAAGIGPTLSLNAVWEVVRKQFGP